LAGNYEFHKQDISFRFLHKDLIIKWLNKSIRKEGKKTGPITFIFCSDNYLAKLNKQYLNHNTFTDIITFDYSVKDLVSGDIFISIDRVRENASVFNVSFQNELLRVMVHGVLHLCGYKDKSNAQEKLMRQKEDYYLSLWTKS
jgi:probable rRNA maturation factor